jgi:hypothetical protein
MPRLNTEPSTAQSAQVAPEILAEFELKARQLKCCPKKTLPHVIATRQLLQV